jgi:uncharacterized membrane protein
MFAADFRAWAREVLTGKWLVAGLVCLVGGLLGGGVDLVTGSGSGLKINADGSVVEETAGLLDFIPREIWTMMMTVTVVTALLAFVIGGAVRLGMCTFNINVIKRKESGFMDLFSQFHRLGTGFCMNFVLGLFIFLWSLLLVIPGVIAAFSYAMVPYLMAEFPDLRLMDAIRESKRLMRGNKWRLFCLGFSFIGWELLGALTMGIGYFWINPYRQMAETAFYMHVTGRDGMRNWNPTGTQEF